jgi:hypothetical protein
VDATGTNIALFTDNDGAPNLLEFAFGTSPMDAASRPVISSAILTDPGSGLTYFQATYLLREGTTGITVMPQFSADLAPGSWQDLAPSSIVSRGDNTALVTVQLLVPDSPAPGGQRFIRVQVQVP